MNNSIFKTVENSKIGFKTKLQVLSAPSKNLKLISGWSHSRSVNTMPQRIAKSSSKYPPKTQWKKITQLIYSQYWMIKNYCIKFTEKPKCIEMEIRNEQPTWISTSHKQLRNSPRKKNNKIPPKSHSLSQAKTSELPPTAKYHFVVN